MQTTPERSYGASKEKLLQDLKSIVRDGEDLLKVGVDELSSKGRQAKEKLANTLSSCKETIGELESKAATKVKEADEVIRSHPYQSMGVALGLGLLMGLALFSSSSKETEEFEEY